jgi:hypothetical protein
MFFQNADAGTPRPGSKSKIPHPRFGSVEGLLSGIESALITDQKVNGASLVELFHLSEMDRYGMVSAAKYLDESGGYPLRNFRNEITKCVTAVRHRLERGEIPENWHQELMVLLGIKKVKG